MDSNHIKELISEILDGTIQIKFISVLSAKPKKINIYAKDVYWMTNYEHILRMPVLDMAEFLADVQWGSSESSLEEVLEWLMKPYNNISVLKFDCDIECCYRNFQGKCMGTTSTCYKNTRD